MKNFWKTKRLVLSAIPVTFSLMSSSAITFAGSYTVESGDTLWGISRKHRVSVEELLKINRLSDVHIELGQVLIIPEKEKVKQLTPAGADKNRKTSHLNPVSHRVVEGDSLDSLAQKYHTTIEILQKRNHLKSNILETGQIVLIAPPRILVSVTQKKIITQAPVANKDSSTAQIPKAVVVEKRELQASVEVAPQIADSQKKKEEGAPEISSRDPLPSVPSIVESPTQRGLKLLGTKQGEIVRQQVLLDRNGMGPGIIDGYLGSFTKSSLILAGKNRPNTFKAQTALFVEVETPEAVGLYINSELPGTGKHPDFKQATKEQCLMMYQSQLEMLAERYHVSEKLLQKLNPSVDFTQVIAGDKILVPNVAEFKIEEFMTPEGDAIRHKYTRKSRQATHVEVDYQNNRMQIWYNDGSEVELLASFPVTTNVDEGPKNQRTISYFAAAPSYMRKKTGLKLKAGPNSPVGIVWAKLGDGFGIHGTSDGSGNGYNTSSGCIRLSNWDMAVFVKIVPSKTEVSFITGAKSDEKVAIK